MKPKTRLVAGLAALALAAAACGGGGEEAAVTTVTTTSTTVPETTTTTTSTVPRTTTSGPTTTTTLPLVPRQPLTGEPLDSIDDVLQRPALAVKIDNASGARRNHTGLAIADIVFEEKVEDSITRFAAVFHSTDPDPIGPIRSGRSQDVDILSSLNSPLFAWSGGNAGVTRLIRDSFLTDLNAQRNSGSYYRGPGRNPHNFYSSAERLYDLTPDDHPGPPFQQFEYLRDGESFDGEPAESIDLTIGRYDMEWDWNADDDRYERSQEGTKHVDKTYGQIGADNVIVMVVDYKPSQIDRRSPEAQTIGEGQVFVFSDGKVIEGTWQHAIAIFPFILTDSDGDPIALTPGQTWVELLENPDSNLTFEP